MKASISTNRIQTTTTKEKKLLEKNKYLKNENRKLMSLLKESEDAMTKKLK